MTDLRLDLLENVAAARQGLEQSRQAEALAGARMEAAIVEAARSGVPQREIASSARVSQPYVSQVVATNRDRFVPKSELGYLLASHRREVKDIVSSYRCRSAAVFGSVARGEDQSGSDIDLLVDIPNDMGLITLARMEQEIADVLGVSVDVAPKRLLKPGVQRNASVDAVLL